MGDERERTLTEWLDSIPDGHAVHNEMMTILERISELETQLLKANEARDSYGAQLRDYMKREEAASDDGNAPKAWMVKCPVGHEYDYLVIETKENAELHAKWFNEDRTEGQTDVVPIPLHTDTRAKDLEAQLAKELAENESLRQSIVSACDGTGCVNAHELRQALDRERDRVATLESTCRMASGILFGQLNKVSLKMIQDHPWLHAAVLHAAQDLEAAVCDKAAKESSSG